MRPPTWTLQEVDSVGLHRQSGIHAPNLGIVKILKLHHISKNQFFGRTRQDKIFILINHNRTMVQRKTSFKYISHIIHSTHDKMDTH
jgi:hypothetical protein